MNENPSANLTLEQRRLLLNTRAYLYALYVKHLALYDLFKADEMDFLDLRDLLGQLNYQLGIYVAPNTERYEYVVTYPDEGIMTGTLTHSVSGLDMSAEKFRQMIKGVWHDLR